ncbi:hypothetical protein [Yinghuangia seranimata]|uniref:hypothetical protein n=1 Tax=Yinghuangia seranimata TaxID=408067 RepID=UPI00248D2587|nr:hypothetical protein [Yinghuangia seranimata]MDI2129124.1 hypothetical protein [Yinghuangia seranimata]
MYELSAVIADFELLCGCAAEAGDVPVPVAALRDGLGLVPAEDVPLHGVSVPGTRPGGPRSGEPLTSVPPALEAVLSRWSRRGPVAYVEAEFFGGAGSQAAVVWRAGVRQWGPAYDDEFTGPRPHWPINHALALLGAVRADQPSGRDGAAPRYVDLFHRAGLGWERGSDAWRAAGRAVRASGHAAALAQREARFLAAADTERRRQVDELPAVLDGRTIMDVLGLPPGPAVGAAARYLKELAQEHGPLTRDEAVSALRAWRRRGTA